MSAHEIHPQKVQTVEGIYGRLEKPDCFDGAGKGGVEFSWVGKVRS